MRCDVNIFVRMGTRLPLTAPERRKVLRHGPNCRRLQSAQTVQTPLSAQPAARTSFRPSASVAEMVVRIIDRCLR